MCEPERDDATKKEAAIFSAIEAEIPSTLRDLYADMAAEWVRAHGTLPSSLDELVKWATETDSGVSVESEIAYLEGKGPDPRPSALS